MVGKKGHGRNFPEKRFTGRPKGKRKMLDEVQTETRPRAGKKTERGQYFFGAGLGRGRSLRMTKGGEKTCLGGEKERALPKKVRKIVKICR